MTFDLGSLSFASDSWGLKACDQSGQAARPQAEQILGSSFGWQRAFPAFGETLLGASPV